MLTKEEENQLTKFIKPFKFFVITTYESWGIRPETLFKKVLGSIFNSLILTKLKTSTHLILKGGKLLQYVTQFVSLACSVVSVNLDKAAEWLWHKITYLIKNTISPVTITCQTKWITNPCAVCDKGINVIFSLVVIVQTASVKKQNSVKSVWEYNVILKESWNENLVRW